MRVGIQVGRLGHHVQSRKQGQSLIENQIHDMAFAFGAGELQAQQGEPCLRGRDHPAPEIAGLSNQAGQVAIRQQRQKQEQSAELSREATRSGARENSRQSATAAAVGWSVAGRSASWRRGNRAKPSSCKISQMAVVLKGVSWVCKALSMS